jgi:hypothetical protein
MHSSEKTINFDYLNIQDEINILEENLLEIPELN